MSHSLRGRNCLDLEDDGSRHAVDGSTCRSPSICAGAFISYSRQKSGGLAVALERNLERFAKQWYRLRAVRVFRDDSDLSANPDLRGSIEAELARCGWFILLASPKAAQSLWVEVRSNGG